MGQKIVKIAIKLFGSDKMLLVMSQKYNIILYNIIRNLNNTHFRIFPDKKCCFGRGTRFFKNGGTGTPYIVLTIYGYQSYVKTKGKDIFQR